MSSEVELVERPITDAAVQAEIRRLTRRSFATGAFAALLGGGVRKAAVLETALGLVLTPPAAGEATASIPRLNPAR